MYTSSPILTTKCVSAPELERQNQHSCGWFCWLRFWWRGFWFRFWLRGFLYWSRESCLCGCLWGSSSYGVIKLNNKYTSRPTITILRPHLLNCCGSSVVVVVFVAVVVVVVVLGFLLVSRYLFSLKGYPLLHQHAARFVRYGLSVVFGGASPELVKFNATKYICCVNLFS